jgi:HEAT repeat protein
MHGFQEWLIELLSAFEREDPDLHRRLIEVLNRSEVPAPESVAYSPNSLLNNYCSDRATLKISEKTARFSTLDGLFQRAAKSVVHIIEYKDIERLLLEALESTPNLSALVAEQLLRLGHPPTTATITALQRVAEGSDTEASLAARDCLLACCRQGIPLAATVLPQAMQDPRPETRVAAIRAWREMGIDLASGAVGDLIKALEDEEAAVRLEAVSTLAWLGPEAEAAVPPLLEKMTAGPDESARDAATRALLAIDHPEHRLILTHLEAIRGEIKREELLNALRKIGPEARSLRVRLQTSWRMSRGLTPHPDGPEPPDKLWWGGRYAELTPQPFTLLRYMWKKDWVAEEVVGKHVWEGGSWSTNQLKVALNKVNQALEEVGVPWRYRQKHRRIVKRLLAEGP